MKYADIEKVNSELKMTNIKGKNYAEVPQRVQAFRKLFPDGFIMTDMISNENGVCVFQATAGYYTADHDMVVLATGMAYENEKNGMVNKTSYIENCETSAVGRCLGFLGLGSETSIASADEVSNAIEIQKNMEQKEKASVTITKSNKVPTQIPEFDPVEAIKGFCQKFSLSSAKFNGMRETLVKGKVVPDVPYKEMSLQQVTELLAAIQRNYGKELIPA